MVNMLKVLVAATVLLAIIGIAMLGKNLARALIFRSAKTKNNEGLFLEIITGILSTVIALSYYLQNKPDATMLMWSGTLIFFMGGILQLVARKQLYDDKTFEERLSAVFEAAQIGIYSKLRYPSKTALLLLLLGFCLAMGSLWATGLLMLLFFPSMLYKISQEEQELLDKFGERWLAYKEDTKRIIPGIL